MSATRLNLAKAALTLSASKKRRNRTAAIFIPLLTVRGQPSLLFTRRSHDVGTHKGQISFPGGHLEEGESIIEAATREMSEELGHDFTADGAVEFIGNCGEIPSITGTLCHPILGVLNLPDITTDVSEFFPNSNKTEVDVVFSRTIEDLMDSEITETVETSRTGFKYKAAAFPDSPSSPKSFGKIWGLTAMILSPVLKEALAKTFVDPSQIKL